MLSVISTEYPNITSSSLLVSTDAILFEFALCLGLAVFFALTYTGKPPFARVTEVVLRSSV